MVRMSVKPYYYKTFVNVLLNVCIRATFYTNIAIIKPHTTSKTVRWPFDDTAAIIVLLICCAFFLKQP